MRGRLGDNPHGTFHEYFCNVHNSINMLCYLMNESPLSSLETNVAKDVRICNYIDLDNLKSFGILAYVHISSEDQSKLDPKLKKCIVLYYAKDVKGFTLLDLDCYH